MGGPLQRYQELGLRDSLCVSYRYSMACKELGVILRLAYSKSPKPLQSLLFDDTIFAFRLLPQMQTKSAVAAVNLLIQSAEAALPKQKRALAASEFKQAKIICKRRGKTQEEEKDPVQLPQDVLVHLFGFLDLQSLVSASSVCRLWSAAANDNFLWQFHYTTHFGESESILKMEALHNGRSWTAEGTQDRSSSCMCPIPTWDWRDAFKKAYLGLPSWRYKYNRGFCYSCNSVVWLSNLKCPNQHQGKKSVNEQLKPLSPRQIVEYMVDDSPWSSCHSDSDTESEEETGLKFWTYIRH